MNEDDSLNELSNHAFRENSGKLVAYLCRVYGLKHLDAIGDIVQDTFETALIKWRFGKIPENPGAWLMTVAKNKGINYFKRSRKTEFIDNNCRIQQESSNTKEPLINEIEDSQLRLLLTCCQPSLSEKSQVIVTLNILSGFGNKEIANGLFMKPEAVKKALMRAKKFLREEVKQLEPILELDDPERINVIHTVLYLMFNEGYKLTKSSQLINHDLCYESMRLSKLILTQKAALHHKTHALLALHFFTVARFPSRITDYGSIVLLADQDRTKWNQELIKEGHYYLEEAKKSTDINKYLLEALISSLHCLAISFETTPWELIVNLYEKLEVIEHSPISTLNKIVALSYLQGPTEALQELEQLNSLNELENLYILYAVKGDLYYRIGKPNLAKLEFKKAHLLAQNEKEKELLGKKIQKLN